MTAGALGALIGLVDAGTISTTVAKDVFEKMYGTGRRPPTSSRPRDWRRSPTTPRCRRWCGQVMAAQPDAVAQYRLGKKATFGFLVGEVMKASGGKANPKRLSQLLRATLDAPVGVV